MRREGEAVHLVSNHEGTPTLVYRDRTHALLACHGEQIGRVLSLPLDVCTEQMGGNRLFYRVMKEGDRFEPKAILPPVNPAEISIHIDRGSSKFIVAASSRDAAVLLARYFAGASEAQGELPFCYGIIDGITGQALKCGRSDAGKADQIPGLSPIVGTPLFLVQFRADPKETPLSEVAQTFYQRWRSNDACR
jgi:hypothetical protein